MDATKPAPQHTPASLRAARGLKRTELAARAGVTPKTVWSLERGFDVSMASVRKIAVALDVDLAVLVQAIDALRDAAAKGAA